MFVSPGVAIVKREFLSGLRSAKPFMFLMFLMLVMIGGLVFMLSVILDQTLRFGGSIGGQEVRMLFMVFSFGLYFSAVLLVPPMAGVSICVEKQQDSYDLLRMTYIRPLALAVAKLLNVLGIYALVAIATLPVVGVFFFLVGIDWTQFILSFVIIAASALSCAVIGLLCSAWFYRTLPAIITTYVVVFFFHGGFLLVLGFMSMTLFRGTLLFGAINWVGFQDIVVSFCPMVSLVMVGTGYYSIPVTLVTLLYHGAIVLIGLKLTLVILNRPTRPMHVETERPIDDQAILEARRKQFPYYLIDPRRRRAMIPDDGNPMYAKELQTGLLGRGTFCIRVFYGFAVLCFFVSFLTLADGAFGSRAYGPYAAWPVFIDTIIILFITPTLIATALAKEQEWGNLDMLRMTLLKPGQIVGGKFVTAFYTALIPIGAAVIGCLPLLFFSYHSPEAWAGLASGFGTMAVCVLFLLCLTLLVTVTCRRGVTALMLGYGASLCALLLLPAVVFIADLTATHGRGSGEAELIAFLSPPLAQFANISDATPWNDALLTNRYWLANITCFSLIAAGLLFMAKRRFSRYLARGAE